VEGDTDDTGLASNTLGSPAEVTRVETEGTELAVTTAGAHEMDALGADTGVGGLTTLLESSVVTMVRQLSISVYCIVDQYLFLRYDARLAPVAERL